MDEHPLVASEVCLRDECVVCGDERFGNRAGIIPRHARWNARNRARGHGDELCMRSAARDAEYAISNREAMNVAPNARDLARVLETGDVCGRSRRCRITALALVDVRSVESGRAHANQHVIRARSWGVDVANLEHLRPAGTGNDDCSHSLYARGTVVERQYAKLTTSETTV